MEDQNLLRNFPSIEQNKNIKLDDILVSDF